jgi:hypothetical protein
MFDLSQTQDPEANAEPRSNPGHPGDLIAANISRYGSHDISWSLANIVKG